MKSFDLELTPDIIVWTFYGDRQLNGDYFYYAYFDIERQNHDLYLLNLVTLDMKKIDNKDIENLVRHGVRHKNESKSKKSTVVNNSDQF